MPRMPTITIQLVHIQGPLKGRIQDFTQFPVHIGRHSSCQVRFDKDLTTVSRRHARIERHGNRFRIIDASTNGTYVNGKRIADVYLRDGDVITFAENGPKTSFLTKIEASDATTSTPAPPQAPAAAVPAQPQASVPPQPPSMPAAYPHDPEPGLTTGPDQEIPVMSKSAPLVIQFGPTLRSYKILPVTIGTDPACEFVIPDRGLAPRHVQIFFNDDSYYAKDLTGTNLVSINGRPIGTQMVLAQGAELSLSERGPKFRFLGGGRLAEIQDAEPEPLKQTDIDPSLQSPDNDAPGKRKKDGKANSLFKSFFS
jgi:pSer/pThr/pTyr-binding forkhead associated (FHA) protein